VIVTTALVICIIIKLPSQFFFFFFFFPVRARKKKKLFLLFFFFFFGLFLCEVSRHVVFWNARAEECLRAAKRVVRRAALDPCGPRDESSGGHEAFL
jgi:hypothetical protein